MSYRKQQHELILEQSKESFAKHQIRKADEQGGRWLLQRRYRDDTGWDSSYAVEIVALWGGMLYVGGDIGPIIFAYGPGKKHRGLVRWMGECTDLRYYVAQKAKIGMSGYDLTSFDHEAAMGDLRDRLEDLKRDDDEGYDKEIQDFQHLIDNNRRWHSSESELHEAILEELGSDWFSDMNPVGHVLKASVYYAHAALAKLCAIWRHEEEAIKARSLHLVKG